MSETRTTVYRCTKCKAEDRDRSASPPAALNCWKCGAGRGLEIPDMIASQRGMLPVEVVA